MLKDRTIKDYEIDRAVNHWATRHASGDLITIAEIDKFIKADREHLALVAAYRRIHGAYGN